VAAQYETFNSGQNWNVSGGTEDDNGNNLLNATFTTSLSNAHTHTHTDTLQ